MRQIAIVGGGIAGLAAAYFLRDQAEVTVLESSPRLGGKLAVGEVAGLRVDSGAEALLARRPEGIDLITELGLADQLRQPGTTSARIWTRGEFRPLPKRQFMGVPGDLDELERTRIISPAGLDRARAELLPAPRTGDVSVARYVGDRLGPEIVDRLVEPLLGGVYAGRADQLSFDATLPVLAKASRDQPSLIASVRNIAEASSTQPEPGRPAPPVFTTLEAGLGTLPLALAQASRATVKTKATVRELARTPAGWRLTIGPTIAPQYLDADAVILALPAKPASRLIASTDAATAAALAEIEYASMAIVTLAYPASAFPEPLTGSGYLVPAVDDRAVKAATFSTVKWPHLHTGDLHVVRCSVGRIGEEAVLQRDDSRPGRARRRGLRGRDRGHRRSGRFPGDQVGRRPASVHGRSPGPGRRDPGWGRRAGRPGGLRRRLRWHRSPRVHRLRAASGRPGSCVAKADTATGE